MSDIPCLNKAFCFYTLSNVKFYRKLSKDEYASSIKLYNTVDSSESFIQSYLNLKKPSMLTKGSVSFFIQSMFPSWESNANGGMLYFMSDLNSIDFIWEFLLIKFFSSTDDLFLNSNNDCFNIIGLVVKVNKAKYNYEIQLWFSSEKDDNEEKYKKTISNLQRLLNCEDNILLRKFKSLN